MKDDIFIKQVNGVIKGNLKESYEENVASHILMMLFHDCCGVRVINNPFR